MITFKEVNPFFDLFLINKWIKTVHSQTVLGLFCFFSYGVYVQWCNSNMRLTPLIIISVLPSTNQTLRKGKSWFPKLHFILWAIYYYFTTTSQNVRTTLSKWPLNWFDFPKVGLSAEGWLHFLRVFNVSNFYCRSPSQSNSHCDMNSYCA